MQQINLYLPEFRPNQQPLRAVHMLVAAKVLFVLLLGVSFFTHRQCKNIIADVEKEQKSLQETQSQLLSLSAKKPTLTDLQLDSTIDLLEKKLQRYQLVLDIISNQNLGNDKGFSSQLNAMAQASLATISIENFALLNGGTYAEISGRTRSADQIPLYLKNLRADPSFNKVGFGVLNVERDEKNSGLLVFSLSKPADKSKKKGGLLVALSIKEIQEKIDERILRERVLICLSLLAAIFMLWNFLIQIPLEKKSAAAKTKLDEVVAQKASLQSQITTITQALLNDPNKPKKDHIEQLSGDTSAMEAKLQSVSQSLIKVEYLPQALQDVLQKTSHLTLLQVTTLPARELHLKSISETNQAEKTEAENTGVFEHAVDLRVSGNYTQVMEFLTALEKLPWRFYWQSLDYKVTQYPTAEIILRVYTLSSEEGLFGV